MKKWIEKLKKEVEYAKEYHISHAEMAKLGDAAGSKSAVLKGAWGFDSPSRHSFLNYHMVVTLNDVLGLIKELAQLEAENEAWMRAVAGIEACYPEDVFPPKGQSLDCASARFARGICKNIREYVEDIRTATAGKEAE